MAPKTVITETGVDLVARELRLTAATVPAGTGKVLQEQAGRLRLAMIRRTRSRRIAASVTADPSPTPTPTGLYTEVGPDSRVSNQAFIARFHERGTVKMAPRPFAGPAADEIAPGFGDAMSELGIR